MPSTLYIVGVHNTPVYGEVISDGGKSIIHKTILMQNTGCMVLIIRIGVKVKTYCLNVGKIELRLNFQKSN